MGAKIEMALARNKKLIPAPDRKEPQEPSKREQRLNITVVFTSVDATLSALKKAAALANRLAARITLVVPRVVPYPLPLESPPGLVDWNERRFRVIVGESPVETMVQIYLCRDRVQTLSAVLRPHSLVVLGDRKRWWPTWETRLARMLRRDGHEVILAETGSNDA